MRTIISLLFISFLLCGGSYVYATDANLVLPDRSIPEIYAFENSSLNNYTYNDNSIDGQDDFVFNAEDEDEEHDDGKQESPGRDALIVFISFRSHNYADPCKNIFYCGKQILSADSSLYIVQRTLRI